MTSSINETSQFVRFQTAYATQTGENPIIFDSGASVTITPFCNDFQTFDTNVSNVVLQGISASAICKGQGKVKFEVIDDDGRSRTIHTTALFVPDARVCLLSVQSYCKELGSDACFSITASSCYFQFPSSSSVGGDKGGWITFDLQCNGNLPKTTAYRQRSCAKATGTNFHSALNVLSDDNNNLSRSQKFLLEWHFRLGHAGMQWVQWLMRHNIIPNTVPGTTTTTCLCKACQLGKQVRQSEGVNSHAI